MDRAICYSPIAFDMGATHTGVFSFTKTGDTLTAEDRHFYTIVLPPDSSQFKYSMQARTAKRHQVRGYKRFKLARRMLFGIIRARLKAMGVVLEPAEQERLEQALSGLLKRRGYSRVEVEADISSLDAVDPRIFAKILPEFFSEFTNLRAQWAVLSQDLSQVGRLKDALEKLDQKPFKALALGKEEEKAATDAKKALSLAVRTAVSMTAMGHKHRKDYLVAIEKEIARDKRLAPAIAALGSEKKLLNLVGNISNLQERAGRWYFDGKEKAGFYFNPTSLKSSLIRAFKFFHPDSDRREAFGRLIQTLRASDDIVETLCEIDPLETIPPYEDQNNRRPPIDMTLLLNPAALTKEYGGKWQIWVHNLLRKEPFMEDDLDVILASNDRASARPVQNDAGAWNVRDEYKAGKKHDSYVLQRFLDRSKAADAYSLRLISRHAKSAEAQKALQHLADVLGSQHVEAFLGMAARYYEETQAAKSGLWEKDASSLLERSNLHPPMIGKVLDHLLCGILGKEVAADKFRKDIWKQRIGRSTVCSICRKIEEVRKKAGNGFKVELDRALEKNARGQKLDEQQKNLVQVAELTGKTAAFIGDRLGIPETERARFANAFSLAQLYNLIEGDQRGYTSTCSAVHEENLWRMRTDVGANQAGAICSRLPADCVRPFDGVLRRVLDRCAWEAARVKAAEIKGSGLRDSEIEVICIAEQNHFAYSATLAELKGNGTSLKKAKEAAKKAEERDKDRWKSKLERIEADSMGICPYTGDSLTGRGEYDHILPRALSKVTSGTVFNSEINLIYCSQKGNAKKMDSRYFLSDLNSGYLKRVFGTSDTKAVEEKIKEEIKNIAQQRGRIFVELLTDGQRRALRHALFLEDGSPERQRALDMMGARLSTIVNGTQGWFLKAFQKKLRKELAPWCEETGCTLTFEARQTKAEVGSDLRRELAKTVPETKKEELQSAASHCIDALCAYAVAAADPLHEKIFSMLHCGNLKDPKELRQWLPKRCEVVRAEQRPLFRKEDAGSRPLYKDTIFGERFLPIIEFKNSVWVGFGLTKAGGEKTDRAIQVTGKCPGELIRLLQPFFKTGSGNPAKSPVAHHIDKTKAFDFLWNLNKRTGTEEEKAQAALLGALHYETCKENVEKYFRDISGKVKNPDKWEEPKGLSIKVELPSSLQKSFDFSGNLRLPAADHWDRLFNDENLRKATDADKQFEALKKFFGPGSDRGHAGVRRIFSLPIVKGASGGFRIRRKGFHGESVYQLQAISDRFTSGFELNGKGGVDWKKPSILPMYATKNLTPLDEDQKYREVDFASADRWEIIGEADGVKVEMCPATKPRPSFRITQPAESFYKSYEAATGISVRSILQVAPDAGICKDTVKGFKATFPEALRGMISLPTTALNVLSLGEQVTYMYKTRDGYSADQKKAYEKAIAEKSK